MTASLSSRLKSIADLGAVPPLPRFRARRITEHLAPHQLEVGQVLMRQGTTGRDVFIVTSGSARVCTPTHELATIGPGDVIGEIAVLGDVPRTATVMAAEDLSLLRMNRRQFATVMDLWPQFAQRIMIGACVRLMPRK